MHFSDLVGAVTSLTVVIGLITTVYKAIKYFHPEEDTWQDKLAIVLCILAFGLAGFGVFIGMSYSSAIALPVTRQPVPVISTVIPRSGDGSNDQTNPTPGTTPTMNTTSTPKPAPANTPTAGTTSTVIPTASPVPTGTATPVLTPQGVTPGPSPSSSSAP